MLMHIINTRIITRAQYRYNLNINALKISINLKKKAREEKDYDSKCLYNLRANGIERKEEI